MTKREFSAFMAALANAGFRGEPPVFVKDRALTATGNIWYASLKTCTAEQFSAALSDLVRREEFFPALATIHRYVQQSPGGVDGTAVWGKVMGEIRRVGGIYGVPECPDDPFLLEAIRAVGWRAICTASESSAHILRAQLREAYNAAVSRQTGVSGEIPLPLDYRPPEETE